MLRRLSSILIISSSLFGGLAFADAPITTVNVAPNASAPGAPPVVDSQALLSSLSPDERIARLENQVQYLSSYNAQLQSLNQQVTLLRGHLEDAEHQISQLQKQVASLQASKQTAPPVVATPAAPTTKAVPATTDSAGSVSPAEQKSFDQGTALLAKKKYPQAVTAFNTFLTTYPKSTLAPDAHYWLGDLYLAEGQPDKASAQYRIVSNLKTAAKRPDAMVKLGTILLAYGDSSHAKTLFQSVITSYPNTPAAKQAKIRLKGL